MGWYSMRMPKNTNRRPQTQKNRLNKGKSQQTLDMLLDPRGGRRGRVPSGKVYKKWDGKYDA